MSVIVHVQCCKFKRLRAFRPARLKKEDLRLHRKRLTVSGVAFSCVLFAFVAWAGAMGSVTSGIVLHILLAQPHVVTGAIGLVGH